MFQAYSLINKFSFLSVIFYPCKVPISADVTLIILNRMVLGNLVGVDILFIVISTGIILQSGYWLYRVNLKLGLSLYRRLFNLVLLSNIIQSILMVYWILSYYISSAVYDETVNGILTAISIIASIQLMLLIFADVEIIKIFSVLKSGINLHLLGIFRTATLILALIFPFGTSVLTIFITTDWFWLLNTISIGIFSIGCVIYDNIQNFVLIFAVKKFKLSKNNNEPSDLLMQKFKELVVLNIAMLISDWIVF